MIHIGFGGLPPAHIGFATEALGDMANYIMLGIFTAAWFALLALGITRRQKWLIMFSVVIMALTASFAMLSVETTVWAPIWTYGVFLWIMIAMLTLWISAARWEEAELEEVTEYVKSTEGEPTGTVKRTQARKPKAKPQSKSAWDAYDDSVEEVMKEKKG